MDNSSITLINKDKKIPIKFSVFPAGEEYVKIGTDFTSSLFTIILTSADSRSIMRVIMIADAIKQINPKACIELHADYLPYGRQDRVCSPGESFSLKVFEDLIRTRIDKIYSYDVHSRVSEDIIDCENKLKNVFLSLNLKVPEFNLDEIKIMTKPDVIIAPDAGARNRANQYSEKMKIEDIHLIKRRTSSGIEIQCDYDLNEYKTGIIVDDICDGGGTFIASAKVLKELNPDIKLYLIVSHGIFSKGTSELMKYFEDIFVTKDYFNLERIEDLEYM